MNRLLRLASLLAISLSAIQAAERPNFIIIFSDDQGYQDLGCFGSPDIKTPHLDKMASEGLICTDFYVPSPRCSQSRASLLTGVYPKQHGVDDVFWPHSTDGLTRNLKTLADMLKGGGYHTACVGKWHLGHADGYMPTDRGFDYYYGIPYSNDMILTADLPLSGNIKTREGMTVEQIKKAQEVLRGGMNWLEFRASGLVSSKQAVPLVEGKEIIEFPCDQATTSRRYAEKTIEFIEKNKAENFLVYMTPAMPHTPLFASEQFAGKSAGGAYGDTIEELDHAVGMVLSYLDNSGLSDNTFVIFTSDNGPWLKKGDDGGQALPLRSGKGSSYEGGVRVPCVMKMPSRIPAGTVYPGILSTIDLLPTFAAMSGVEQPEGQLINGVDFSAVISDPSQPAPRTELLIYDSTSTLSSLRQGDWKLLINTKESQKSKDATIQAKSKPLGLGPYLFNLKDDIGETTNLAHEHPEKLKTMLELAQKLDAELPVLSE